MHSSRDGCGSVGLSGATYVSLSGWLLPCLGGSRNCGRCASLSGLPVSCLLTDQLPQSMLKTVCQGDSHYYGNNRRDPCLLWSFFKPTLGQHGLLWLSRLFFDLCCTCLIPYSQLATWLWKMGRLSRLCWLLDNICLNNLTHHVNIDLGLF